MITSDDILGKTAVDPKGALLGTVIKLHIDPAKKLLIGITIDQGFVKPDLYVGIDHVKRFGQDAVLLATTPYQGLKGKKIYNLQGKLLGTVHQARIEEGILKELIIKQKASRFTYEDVHIDAKTIKEVGQTIILKSEKLEPPAKPIA